MNDRLIDLARRARGGGRPELEALLAACVGVVHAIARSRLGDGADSESVAMEALVDIARGLPGLMDVQTFPAWIHRITSRRATKLLVARKSDGEVAPRCDGSVQPVAPSSEPVEVLLATERSTRLREALGRLPEALRQPVLLHFVEGMTYREVASMLDVGLGSVVRRMNEALTRLKQELGE